LYGCRLMKKKVWRSEIDFLILCPELCKSTRPRTLCGEPVDQLSAHLTDGPIAVTAVPFAVSSPLCREHAPVALSVDLLCREPCSVPRACYVTSRHRWSAPWVLFVPRASSRTLGKAALCCETILWLSAQNFAHDTGCDSGSD
jgi:hypothetical protein